MPKIKVYGSKANIPGCDHCKKYRVYSVIIRHADSKSLYLCDEHKKNYESFLKSKGLTLIILRDGALQPIPLNSSDITPYIAHTESTEKRIKDAQYAANVESEFRTLVDF